MCEKMTTKYPALSGCMKSTPPSPTDLEDGFYLGLVVSGDGRTLDDVKIIGGPFRQYRGLVKDLWVKREDGTVNHSQHDYVSFQVLGGGTRSFEKIGVPSE